MLTILFTPHATSVDNEARRASGHADVPLSALGREQARRRAEHYASYEVDAVFTSDLQRAAETARIAFAGRAVPISFDSRLRECDYGDLTQFPVERIDEEFPQRIREPFPNGESVMRVVQRVGGLLHEVLEAYDGRSVAVIAHRAPRYALDYWCGKQPLEAIVGAAWAWKEVPIWRYELRMDAFEQRQIPRPP